MKRTNTLHLVIICGATLVALLFSIDTITFFIELAMQGKTEFFLSKEIWKIKFGIFEFFNTQIIIYFLTYFNVFRNVKKLSSNILFNLFLLFISVIFTLFLYLLILGNFRELFQFSIFLWGYKMLYFNGFNLIIAFTFSYVLKSYSRYKATEIENLKLKKEKINAELSLLKEQVSPHFFFNTLTTLSSIIRTKDKDDSLEFIDNMADVYRYLLESHAKNLISIRKEISFVKSYFFLLQKRFGNKISLKIDINENIYDYFVPILSIQVCLENAVTHNICSKENPLVIKIYHKHGIIFIENELRKIPNSEKNESALKNLNQRFMLLLKKEIFILKTDERFIVQLPVVKNEDYNY